MPKIDPHKRHNPAPALDPHDTRILDILSGDGRISISELARKINLSKTPTQARVRRLEAEGFIVGYRAMLDPIRLGLDHVAFVEVTLNDTREAALSQFNQAAVQIGEIEQCHMIAGNFDYLLKVRTRDMSAYPPGLRPQVSARDFHDRPTTLVPM